MTTIANTDASSAVVNSDTTIQSPEGLQPGRSQMTNWTWALSMTWHLLTLDYFTTLNMRHRLKLRYKRRTCISIITLEDGWRLYKFYQNSYDSPECTYCTKVKYDVVLQSSAILFHVGVCMCVGEQLQSSASEMLVEKLMIKCKCETPYLRRNYTYKNVQNVHICVLVYINMHAYKCENIFLNHLYL